MEVVVKGAPKIEVSFNTDLGLRNKADKQGVYPDLIAGDLAGRGESVPAEFSFRASGGKSIKDGRAYIKRIKGNSVVWNNMVDTRHLTGEWSYANDYMCLKNGHIYAFIRTKANAGIYCIPVINGQEKYDYAMQAGVYGIVFTSRYDTAPSNTVIYNEQDSGACALYDLTLMFGAGNEPTTIEEYNARKPIVADEYAFNEGEVIHMTAEGIKSIGDNAFNKDRAIQGSVNDNTGEFVTGDYATMVDLMACLPNTQYYFANVISYYYRACVHYYDADMNYIGLDGIGGSTTDYLISGTLTTPANARFMRVGTYVNATEPCMVTLVHSGWKVDTDAGYQPYWQDILPLPIISKYFPQGMKLAGSAHDEIRFNKASGKWEAVQRVTSLDLGTLAWGSADSGHFYVTNVLGDIGFGNLRCAKYSTGAGQFSAMTADKVIGNNAESPYNRAIFVRDDAYTDAESFKASLQGVMLYYELAEPIVTELDAEDQDFQDFYQVADFGTEQMVAEQPSAAFSADIIYQFNAVDMIRENYNEIQKLKAMLTTLQAQLASK